MERLGATAIIADEIGHRVLEPGGEAHEAVAETWPQVVVDGRIDRRRLAAIVFADPEELTRLEAMTHPAIAARLASEAAAVDGDVVVETPVPAVAAGDGWARVLVDAPPRVRLDRAVARGGNREDVVRRMAAQLDREEWLAWADHVIVNDGTVDDLERAVVDLWDRLAGPGVSG